MARDYDREAVRIITTAYEEDTNSATLAFILFGAFIYAILYIGQEIGRAGSDMSKRIDGIGRR